MAEALGYSLLSVDALSEFRAIYVGLWLATAVLLVVAIRRVEVALLGDLCAILVLGQTGGRIVSLLLDGIPSKRVWPIFLLEAVGGIALLGVRPSTPRSTMSGAVEQADAADEVREGKRPPRPSQLIRSVLRTLGILARTPSSHRRGGKEAAAARVTRLARTEAARRAPLRRLPEAAPSRWRGLALEY
jgi:hypothetical protein